MKKKFLILFIILLLPLYLIGYIKLQAYQEKNWNTFFENKEFSLYENAPLIKLFDFKEAMHLDKSYAKMAKIHFCLFTDDILKKNKLWQTFNHQKLKNKMKQECSKITLIDRENNSLFYKNAWNLCKNEQECKTVLFELDNFLILENSEVAEKKDNTLTFLDYNKFFKEKLNINNPNDVVFLGFSYTGLGNILFQYWSAYIYADKWGKKLIPLSERPIHHVFKDIEKSPEVYNTFKYINYRFTVGNKNIDFKRPQLIISQNPIDYRNLIGYEDIIREKSIFKNPLSKKNKLITQQMQNEESVTIHIRRGDFKDQNIQLLDLSYYKNAIKYIQNKVKNPHFYIFSDDIQWAKENFKTTFKTTFVDWNKKDYEDLELMTYTKHHIIANSTFSWWGAFLKKDTSGIVIVPKTGFYNEGFTDRIAMPKWISIK